MGKYVSVYAYEDGWLGRREGGMSDISPDFSCNQGKAGGGEGEQEIPGVLLWQSLCLAVVM